MASEKCIEWGASGISETAHPRPKAFLASRSDLVLRAQMSLFSVGESRWTTTPGAISASQACSCARYTTPCTNEPCSERRAMVALGANFIG
jgi:hypothetical protein